MQDNQNNERALIGSLLFAPDKVLKVAKNYGLTPEHFTDENSRLIFGAALRLEEQSKPKEALTIKQESGLDIEIITSLIDDSPTAANAEYYARLIRDSHIKRQALAEIGKTDGAEGLRMVFENWLYQISDISLPAQAVNCSSWLNEPDLPEQPIIEGLFDAGDRVAIVGQSKARKSFYTLQLAIAIATGCDLLGVTPAAHKVILINGEIAARSYKKRLRRMLAKMEIQPEHLGNLHIANTSECGQVMTFQSILTLTKKHQAAVCIVDPAYLLFGDEIDQRQVKESVLNMKKFAADGITLISVFHATKGKIGDKQAIDRISGSGIFARDVSTLISLCEHASEPDHVVINSIARNYPPSEPITACFEDGAFQITDIVPIEKTSSTRAKRTIPLSEAIKHLPDNDISYGDAIDLLKVKLAIGRNRAVELIGEMRDKDMLFAMKLGKRTMYSVIKQNAV